MRLYANHVPKIAPELVRALVAASQIESERPAEVILDVESVLKSYLETEKEVNERTRELLQRTNRGQNEYNKVRQQIADSKGIKVGDEALDYLLDQVLEMLMHSGNVEEVFGQDVELRRTMIPIFKKYMAEDETIDAEVRAQLKHVKEGTRDWDVEHARILEQVRRKRGLQ
jgi:hypothetical protein